MSNQYNFKKVFAAACLGMLLFGVVIITLGSILPSLIDKFEFDELQAGTLASILPLGILIGSLVFGPIVDRYSYKSLLVICVLIILVGMEGLAFADRYVILQMSVLGIGLGGGAINGGTNALVADISAANPEKRSANLSLLGVFFGVGALAMPSIMGILNSIFHYQQILMAIGLALLLPAFYFALVQFPQPKQSQGLPISRIWELAKNPNLLLLGLVLFFQSGIEGILNNWSPLYLEKEIEFSISRALFSLTLFILSLTLTRLILAFILKAVRPYQILLVSVVLLIAGVSILAWTGTEKFQILGLVLLGAGLAAGFPIILGYVGDLHSDISGTAFSLVFVIALSGNILLNFLMGAFSQNYGLSILPGLVFTATICLAAVMGLSLYRISGKTRI